MSRIGKHPVPMKDVNVEIVSGILKAKGKLGELAYKLHDAVEVTIEDGMVVVTPKGKDRTSRSMWGTAQRRIANAIQGVSEGFEKKLEVNGVGYRAAVQGKTLVMNLGFSHDVRFDIPEDVQIKCPSATTITVSGIDKARVGQVAAQIREYRRPEPYKGKGVKYAGEKIYRKEGKKK